MSEPSRIELRRGFVDVPAGQVHYRYAKAATGGRPLVMLHPSPGSAKMLEGLARRFAQTRPVYALDTLGNGDSSPAPADGPGDIAYFAKAHRDAIDALGLSTFDLYGGHTGGNLACEIAIAWPDRVGALILDGMSLYSEAERAEMLERYAPPLEITSDGRHVIWLWNFIRDTFLFWPWYKQDAAHVRAVGLPAPDALHDKFVEVVKSARTYRVSYNAAFAYRKEDRLPLVRTPTLLSCGETDMLLPYLDDVARLMPHARKLITCTRPKAAADASQAVMVDFLDTAGAAVLAPSAS